MTISRRKFLEAGILTSIVTGAAIKSTTFAAAQRSAETESVLASSINYYNRSTFAAYLNSDFRVVRANKETWLRLVLAEDFDTGEVATPTECFRLLFSGSVEDSLRQGTYQFEHAALGTFPMFIVPRNPANGKRAYEAVFNRLSGATVAPTLNPNPVTNPPVKNRSGIWENDNVVAPDVRTQTGIQRPGRLEKE